MPINKANADLLFRTMPVPSSRDVPLNFKSQGTLPHEGSMHSQNKSQDRSSMGTQVPVKSTDNDSYGNMISKENRDNIQPLWQKSDTTTLANVSCLVWYKCIRIRYHCQSVEESRRTKRRLLEELTRKNEIIERLQKEINEINKVIHALMIA